MGRIINENLIIVINGDCTGAETIQEFYGFILNNLKEINMENLLTPIVKTPVNNYITFAILPCGSKFAWKTQENHNYVLQEAICRMYKLKISGEYFYSSWGRDGGKVTTRTDTTWRNEE